MSRKCSASREKLAHLRDIGPYDSGEEFDEEESDEEELLKEKETYVIDSDGDEPEDEPEDDGQLLLADIIQTVRDEDRRDQLIRAKLTDREGNLWSTEPIRSSALGNQISAGGPAPLAMMLVDNTAQSALGLFLTDSLLFKICHYTNISANDLNVNLTLDPGLLRRWIGLVIARSVFYSSSVPASAFWSNLFGIKLFGEAMSKETFKAIDRCIRFDDKSTREQRTQADDQFAAISEIWNDAMASFREFFSPGASIAIGEQLFKTKARCKFAQFGNSKPDLEFGIKFGLGVDCDTSYVLNAIPILREDEARSDDFGEQLVKQIVKPYEGRGLHVIAGGLLTSKALGDYLHSKNTTLCGIVRPSQRFIPPYLTEKMKLYDSKVVYNQNASLLAHKTSKRERLFLYSTLHQKVDIPENGRRLPKPINHYNTTKNVVDNVSRRLKKCTVTMASGRWTKQVFWNLLDIAIWNACIVYRSVNNSGISKLNFVRKLTDELVACEASVNPNPANLKLKLEKRKRCSKERCNNKTSNLCFNCERAVCGPHSDPICRDCVAKLSSA